MSSMMCGMLLGAGVVSKKTYVDDVFSTFLYRGSGSARQIVNGIDLSGEGGLVWIKNRDASDKYILGDTVRGVNKYLSSNSTAAETNDGSMIMNSHSNAFSVGAENEVNTNGEDYSSWTFRKGKGFFDVVTFNETGSPHADFTVSHSLGCIPGMIILKRTDGSSDWWVWHKYDPTGLLRLNTTAANLDMTNDWCIPTSTNFTFRPTYVGAMGAASWVAYLFADGFSKEATSRSVYFDGSSDYLLSTSSDYSPGTGDFTMEAWVNIESGVAATDGIFQLSSTSGAFTYGGIALLYKKSNLENRWELYGGNSTNQSESTTFTGYEYGQWVHTAIVKTSGNIKLYINGEERISAADTQNYSGYQYLGLGAAFGSTYNFKGNISNFKLTIGQALYTSAFTPTNVPLTTTSQSSTASNVKILCCNNSSVTGKTVGATITSNGTVTASTDNPNFIDPAAHIFGESGSESIIKVGSYVGNGNADGPEINLGWEPQYLMIKNSSATQSWWVLDSMRGIANGGNDKFFTINSADGDGNANRVSLTPTGFKCVSGSADLNGNGNTMIYVAIRRPDGYVGKPPELGTDVFTLDSGNSTSIESWTSGFPVDYAIYRRTHYVTDWFTSARLIQGKELIPNTNAAESAWTGAYFDSNNGWGANSGMDSTYLSYMWKRHKGFDVQRYTGKTGQQSRVHGLNAVPEMIWAKSTNNAYEWAIGHKDLTSGWTSKHLRFTNSGEITGQQFALAPTSTHWTTPNGALVNDNGEEYIAMLFASVDGISKVGSYTGDGGSRWLTTGFTPRFILIKRTDGTGDWLLCDSIRGVDKNLYLNTTAASSGGQKLTTSATGFGITAYGANDYNVNNEKYIYYCHV